MKKDWENIINNVKRREIIIDEDIFLGENTLPFSLNPYVQS